MKNDKLKFILILIFTAVLAAVSIGTAVLLRSRGTRPVAPSVPESKPKAYEAITDPFISITPIAQCKADLSVACQTPPIPVPTIPDPPHSPLDISWRCGLTKPDCITIEAIKYAASGGRVGDNCGWGCSSNVGGTLLDPINVGSADIVRTDDGVCHYTYLINEDIQCLDFTIIAKDLAGGMISCQDCTAGDPSVDPTKCCLASKTVTICGLPKKAIFPPLEIPVYKEKVTGGIKIIWQDISEMDQGFKIYRRDASSGSQDGFNNVLPSELKGTITGTAGLGVRNWTDTSAEARAATSKDAFFYSVRAFTNLCEPCGATGTPTLTPTATPPVCVKPSPPTNIRFNGTSRVILRWTCSDPKIDCYTIKKYSSNLATGSDQCTSCPGSGRALVDTFNLGPGDYTKDGDVCTFVDTHQPLSDFKCLSYEITGKNYESQTGTCKDNCTADNRTTCCFSDMASIDICGVPANPDFPIPGVSSKEINQPSNGMITIRWKDNSAEEQGFYIYRRGSTEAGGIDNFEVAFGETPYATVTRTPEQSTAKGETVEYIDRTPRTPIADNFYSIRAYANLCGCPPGVPTRTPTPIPTATRTPTPTSTPGPTVSCDRLEIVKIKKAGESTWRIWQNGMVVELNDKIKLKVTFSGTVDRVAVRVMVSGTKLGDYYSTLGVRQTGFWETSEGDDAIAITRSGDYDITAFVKSNGVWQ